MELNRSALQTLECRGMPKHISPHTHAHTHTYAHWRTVKTFYTNYCIYRVMGNIGGALNLVVWWFSENP